MTNIILKSIIVAAMCFSSCKDGEESDSTYHREGDYKYEYRTGESGNYRYNYDVEGSDENGNGITGNVDMRGKYGSGTIEDEDGDEKEVDVEWVGYGEMEATDEDGNTYELNAE